MFRFTTSVVLLSGIVEPRRAANTKPVAENMPLKKQEDSKIVRSTEISPHKNTDLRARKKDVRLSACLRALPGTLRIPRCAPTGISNAI